MGALKQGNACVCSVDGAEKGMRKVENERETGSKGGVGEELEKDTNPLTLTDRSKGRFGNPSRLVHCELLMLSLTRFWKWSKGE